MKNHPSIDSMKFIAIQLLIMVTFGLAAIGKWIPPGIPENFVDQFGDTWLGSLPGELFIPYYTIAVAETIAFLLAFASFVKMEWKADRSKYMLKLSLQLSLFIFVILSYGLRLTSEFEGAASTFFYFGVTLIALYIVEKEDTALRNANSNQ